MLSPSQGFFYCLPVRLGALVVSLFAFLGSGILAGVTFHSLATISSHITSTQTAGFESLERLTWVYLLIFLPVCVMQSYVYVVIKRFLFVLNGDWDLQQEEAFEQQQRSMGLSSDRRRRTTVAQTIGHGGRRRAKANLRFTMETPGAGAGDSFLPSMILSPMDLTSPRTPFSRDSRTALLSPFTAYRLGRNVVSTNAGSSERSAKMDMDFSDPGPMTSPRPSGERIKPVARPRRGSLVSKGQEKERQSDASVYSGEECRESSTRSTLNMV
ncbi:hypothetical protein K439DRAFT_652003 [Ramaria rubella]|nr:hypothetical protein K439DRAFT_652003 [Ramaria rubella]